MEAFVPPVVGGDIEAWNGRGAIDELGDFFFEGEAGDEVVDAGVDGERGIEKGKWGCGVGWRSGLSEGENRKDEKREGKNEFEFHREDCGKGGGEEARSIGRIEAREVWICGGIPPLRRAKIARLRSG